jgi:hypothetical protein
VLSAFRRAGVLLQRIRPAVQALEATIGIERALRRAVSTRGIGECDGACGVLRAASG